MHRLYLAGPIAGLTHYDATDWREYIMSRLDDRIQCFSPMRGKEYLQGKGVLHGGDYPEHPLSTQRGIMGRDYFDVKRADALLVNLLAPPRVSIGTIMELAWAYAMQKPVVLLMENEGNPHDHLMVNECYTYRTEDIEEAVALCEHLLLPRVKF
jgi:nucleoside 2-deoxyribosyltransferase